MAGTWFRRSLPTRWLVLLVLLALLGITPQPVGAAGPVITKKHSFTETRVPFFGPDGGCAGFEALATYTVTRHIAEYYDEAGQLLLQRRHVSFIGSVINAETGKEVPYSGHFTVTDDRVAKTFTLTGARLRVVLPGQGVVALDAGKEVRSLTTFETIAERGPHYFAERICAVLA